MAPEQSCVTIYNEGDDSMRKVIRKGVNEENL
jgi:hypothetical protein